MPVQLLPHLARLLPVALLLALAGCMDRWELGDVGELLHPRAKPPTAPAPLAGPQPRSAASTPAPGSVR